MLSAIVNTPLALAAFLLGSGAVLVAIGWRLLQQNRDLLEENRRLLGIPEAPRPRRRSTPWGWWLKPVCASAVLLPGVGLTFLPLMSPVPDLPVVPHLPVFAADAGSVIGSLSAVSDQVNGTAGETGGGVRTREGRETTKQGPPARAEGAAVGRRTVRTVSDGCWPVSLGDARFIARQVSRREGIPEGLLLAVIFYESRFAPCAVSISGAQGLMQLKPETALEVGVRNPFDPADNIGGGARYLRKLIARYDGDTALALGAYLHGPTIIDRNGRLPRIPATHRYVRGIQDLADILAPQETD